MADSKLRVQLIGDSSKLTSSLNSAGSKLKKFGKNMSDIGSKMSRFSLPLAIAGGVAIKMGADFDKSMTKIKSLVGIAGDEVDKMGEQARKMAIETGKSSKEAADALFFITSAGLSGSEAMDVLNASLKASAVGLGDVTQVADAATSAMNAYGSDALSASAATDVLVATVREGKLSSEELAGAIGQVIPIASNMGVTFNEVGATMAAMSRTGTNAATASMQLKNILMSINKPSKEAADTLAEMGLSAEDLKAKISKDGLLSTLMLLKQEFGENADAQAKVFGNSRALLGVMDLLGKGIDSTTEIFGKMENVLGDTQNAFDVYEKSLSGRLNKSLNATKESFAKMGDILLKNLLPIIETFAGFITNLFNKFNKLDDTTQKIIIAFTLLVTAIGPILLAVGSMISILPILVTGFTTLSAGLLILKGGFIKLTIAMMANPFVAIATAVVALTGFIVTMANKMAPLISKWETFKNIIKSGGSFSKFASLQLVSQAEAQKKLKKETIDDTDAINEQIKSNVKLLESQQKLTKHSENSKQIKTVNAITNEQSMAINMNSGKVDTTSERDIVGFKTDPATLLAESVDKGNLLLTTKLAETGTILGEKQRGFLNNATEFNSQLGGIMQGGLQNLAVGIGAALGEAIATGGNLGAQLGSVLLGTLGGVATQVGQMAIGIGTALLGIKEALKKLNPFVAIAAGIALVALGAFFSAKSADIASNVGGGGGGGPKEFAKGGIVSTPTMGLMGEYPGARSNPEVIAPLDKLKGMIGDRGGQSVQVGGSFTLKGQDLVVALQRANNQRNRII